MKGKKLLALFTAVVFALACLPATVFAAEAEEEAQEAALTQPNPKYPEVVPIVMDVDQISSSTGHTMALDAQGNVYTWGSNNKLAIGNGSTANTAYPFTAVDLPGRAVQIASGFDVSAALLENGIVYDWGVNSSGSRRTNAQRAVPVKVESVYGVESIAAYSNVFAVTAAGEVWSWGNDSKTLGRKGIGPTPAKISIPKSDAVFATYRYGFAITKNKEIYAWGHTGTGMDTTVGISIATTPAKTGLQNLAYIDAHTNFYGIGTDGSLRVWGSNNLGGLGLGDAVVVDTLTTVIEDGVLHAGGAGMGSYILKDDGTVWGTGSNQYGTLGIGEEDTSFYVDEYTRIEGLESVVALEVTYNNGVFAKTTDGCWWAWGYNGPNAVGVLYPGSSGIHRYFDSPVLIFVPSDYVPAEPTPETHTITVTETWADGAGVDVVNTYTVEDGRPFSALFSTPEGYTAEVTCAENLSINYEAMRVYLYSVGNSFDILVTYTPE